MPALCCLQSWIKEVMMEVLWELGSVIPAPAMCAGKHFSSASYLHVPELEQMGKQQRPPVWLPSHADRIGVGLILSLLFHVLTAGKELFGLDTLQKSLWIQLLEEMFLGMPSEFPWGDEIMLFLNVFNGALILHPEDSALLRQYAATVINSAVHFNHLFSLSGYQWILPTMLQVPWLYSSNT